MAFNSDDKLLVTGGSYSGERPHHVKVWDLNQKKESKAFPIKEGKAVAVAVSADSKLVAANDATEFFGKALKGIRVWDLSQDGKLEILTGDTESIRGLAFSPDSKLLACGGEAKVELWDLASKTVKRTFLLFPNAAVFRLAFSPDGKRLAIGYSTVQGNFKNQFSAPRVGIFDVDSGESLFSSLGTEFKKEANFIHQVLWNATGDKLITSTNFDVVLWNVPGR
jgi:WD40 repeat protein